MKKEIKEEYIADQKSDNDEKTHIEGYPLYPVSEDIYSKFQREDNTTERVRFKRPRKVRSVETPNEKDFEDDISGSDLDIPGTELDDKQEEIGSEDEENNYYSIGGDRHNDLDEDNRE